MVEMQPRPPRLPREATRPWPSLALALLQRAMCQWLTLVVLVATQLSNYVFVPIFGHAGLALSISFGATINAALLFFGLRRRGYYHPLPGWGLFIAQVMSAVLLLAGALLWGVGAALGFPVGMSAAADDPERAAARVSVVSSVGYTAFLAGPPLIGLLGEAVGILNALFVVLGALVLGLAASGAARPAVPSRTPQAHPGVGFGG